MLTNTDIEKLCDKLNLPLIGVFSKNELKELQPKIGSYYINMMDDDMVDDNGNNGSHWVLAKIYCDEDRDDDADYDDNDDKMRVLKALYFDSFGVGMPLDVSEFLKPFKPIYCNNREIQYINSSYCGWYCLACDHVLENYKYSDTYLKDYEMFLEIFNDDPKKNVRILKKFFKI